MAKKAFEWRFSSWVGETVGVFVGHQGQAIIANFPLRKKVFDPESRTDRHFVSLRW